MGHNFNDILFLFQPHKSHPSTIIIHDCIYAHGCFSLVQLHTCMPLLVSFHVAVFTHMAASVWFSFTLLVSFHVAVFTHMAASVWFSFTLLVSFHVAVFAHT